MHYFICRQLFLLLLDYYRLKTLNLLFTNKSTVLLQILSSSVDTKKRVRDILCYVLRQYCGQIMNCASFVHNLPTTLAHLFAFIFLSDRLMLLYKNKTALTIFEPLTWRNTLHKKNMYLYHSYYCKVGHK